jgi:hypothetical protein
MRCESECCARPVCMECRVAARLLVDGVCVYCREAMLEACYIAPRGMFDERRRYREKRSRGQDERDLAEFFNGIEALSGLHAASLAGRTSVALDPHEAMTNKAILDGLAKGRMVEGRLRQLSSLHQRILERVFSDALQQGRATPFPRLSTSFGSLAGVVDLLGGGAGYDDRDLRTLPSDAYVLAWEVRATDAIERALSAYGEAT